MSDPRSRTYFTATDAENLTLLYDEELKNSSERKLTITRKGRTAQPRYLNVFSQERDTPSRREIIQKTAEERLHSFGIDPKNPVKSSPASEKKPPAIPRKLKDVGSRYMTAYEKVRSRDTTPRRQLEERQDKLKKLDLANEEPADRVKRTRSSTPRRRSATPKKYVRAPPTPEEKKEAECRRSSSARKLRRDEVVKLSCSGAQIVKKDAILPISSADLIFLRNLRDPSHAVTLLFQVLCLLFRISPRVIRDPTCQQGHRKHDFVQPMKNLFSHPTNFLRMMRQFNASSVAEADFKRLRRVVRLSEFQLDDIRRSTGDPGYLLGSWVLSSSKAVASALGHNPDNLDKKYLRRPASPPKTVVSMEPRRPSPHFTPKKTVNVRKTPLSTPRRVPASSPERQHLRHPAAQENLPFPAKSVKLSGPHAPMNNLFLSSMKDPVFRVVLSFMREKSVAEISKVCRLLYTKTRSRSIWEEQLIMSEKVMGFRRTMRQMAISNVERAKSRVAEESIKLRPLHTGKIIHYRREVPIVQDLLKCVGIIVGDELDLNDDEKFLQIMERAKPRCLTETQLNEVESFDFSAREEEVQQISLGSWACACWIVSHVSYTKAVLAYERAVILHRSAKKRYDHLAFLLTISC